LFGYFQSIWISGLIRIERDFDLIAIETPSIYMDWGRTEQALSAGRKEEEKEMGRRKIKGMVGRLRDTHARTK
jgi:hypothetical protein